MFYVFYLYIFFKDELVILVKGLEEVICGDIVWFEVDVKIVELLYWLIIW